MDAAEFHSKVYALVRQIPPGRCTSYKHIAVLAGMPRHSRFVGQALKFLQDNSVPWHRVLLSTGQIASRGPGTLGARRQREALEAEGVVVLPVLGEGDDGEGEGGGRINWSEVGWFPDRVNIEIEEENEE